MVSATREAATQRHWTCGRRLRERRHALGLTQTELVARLGGGSAITNRSISTWENGRGLDFGWLPELALALDCSVTYLLGMTDEPRRWVPATEPLAIRAASAVAAATSGPASASPSTSPPPSEPLSTSDATPDPCSATPDPCNWILGPGPMPTDDVPPASPRSPDSR
jgi:transcriptional regulator with XRE-family HTH domain